MNVFEEGFGERLVASCCLMYCPCMYSCNRYLLKIFAAIVVFILNEIKVSCVMYYSTANQWDDTSTACRKHKQYVHN